MSARERKVARHAGRAGAHVNLRREVPSAFWRRRLLAVILVFAGAVSAILIVKNYARPLQPSASPTPEEERPTAPPATGLNLPQTTATLSNKTEAEAGEDRVVTLVSEGNQLLARGNYAEAAQRYEQAVRIDPGDEDLHYNLGIALARLGRTEEAKKEYAETLQIYPEHVDAHNNLGNLLMNENKPTEAIEHFREAIRIMPEHAPFHNNLGTAFGRQNRVAEAMEAFATAIKLKPTYVEARVNLANACLAAGRLDQAIAQLEEALRLQPDFQPALETMRRARRRQASSGAPE